MTTGADFSLRSGKVATNIPVVLSILPGIGSAIFHRSKKGIYPPSTDSDQKHLTAKKHHLVSGTRTTPPKDKMQKRGPKLTIVIIFIDFFT